MTRQMDFEMYQAYCEMIAKPRQFTPEELEENTEKARRQRKENTLRNYRGLTAESESRLSDIAAANCKSKAEWQAEEVNDIRWCAQGAMLHKRAGELVERYAGRIQGTYRAENWYQAQMDDCEKAIEVLEQKQANRVLRPRRAKSIKNKLAHWRARMVELQIGMDKYLRKTERYEHLAMKWRGIIAKIEETEIMQEIAAERRGIGNKYGFHLGAKSRETAEIMFEDLCLPKL